MRFVCALFVLSSAISCKPRNDAESTAASVVVTGNQIEVFTATRAKDSYQSRESDPVDAQVVTSRVSEKKEKPVTDPSKYDYASHVCHLTDCAEEMDGDTKKIVCKTVAGIGPVSAVLKIIEQYPEDEKLAAVLLNIIDPGQVSYSDTDPDVVRAKKLLAPLLVAGTGNPPECERSYQKDAGLSLTQKLFSRNVIINNKTAGELVVKAVVNYSFADWKVYKESPWSQWTFAPGKSGRLSYKSSTEMYSIQYNAYLDGKLIQDNGAGVQFDRAGEDYIINVTGSGGPGNEKYQPSKLLSVEQCAITLKKVHERYPKDWFQKSDYDGERKRCYGAVDEANKGGAKWTPMMKRYYCEHPGIPVRDCFTPLAGLLRKTIMSQKYAYRVGFEYCKNTSGFASMTPAMVQNFKQIMVKNWTPSDNDACWTRFLQMSE